MSPETIAALRRAARHAAPIFEREEWRLAGADCGPPDALDLFCHLARLTNDIDDDTVRVSSGRFDIERSLFDGFRITVEVGYLEGNVDGADDDACICSIDWNEGCPQHGDDALSDDELPGMWEHADFTGGQEVVR